MFRYYFHYKIKVRVARLLNSMLDYIEMIFFPILFEESRVMNAILATSTPLNIQLKYRTQPIAQKWEF